MKRLVICLTALQLLAHAKAYAYANEAECISALTTTQSDASLVKMICATTTYTPPKSEDDIRWEKEKEELQLEALSERNQKETEQTWERIRNQQEQARIEREQRKLEQERLKQERLELPKKVLKCDYINAAIEREVKSGRPKQSAVHDTKRFDPVYTECKRICVEEQFSTYRYITWPQSNICRKFLQHFSPNSKSYW